MKKLWSYFAFVMRKTYSCPALTRSSVAGSPARRNSAIRASVIVRSIVLAADTAGLQALVSSAPIATSANSARRVRSVIVPLPSSRPRDGDLQRWMERARAAADAQQAGRERRRSGIERPSFENESDGRPVAQHGDPADAEAGHA